MKKVYFFVILFFSSISFFAQGNELIFDEEFVDNQQEWPIDKNSNNESFLDNGYYYIYNHDTEYDYRYYTSFDFDTNSDFVIETKLRQVYGSNTNAFGLMFCSDGVKSNYNFEIKCSGMYRISTKTDDQYDTKTWSTTTYIKHKGEYNILKVEKVKDKINYYINDHLISTKTVHTFFGKDFGFIIRGVNKIQIDYLKIYGQTPKINIVANPISQPKENLGRNINTPYTEIMPFITADGKTMYFVRDDYPGNVGKDKDHNDIWYSKFNGTSWTKAQNIGSPLNNEGHNFVIYATPDGNTLIVNGLYSAFGEPEGNGISITHKNSNNTWSVPKRIKIDNFYNDDKYQNFAFTPDLQVMVLAIKRNDDTYGESDLYVSFRKADGTYSEPKNMGNVVNTDEDEGTPFIAADGKTLYFYSEGHPGYGSGDIFMTKRLDNTWTNWSTPLNLGPNVNSSDWDAYFTLDAQGKYAYLVSSSNAIGEEDIFSIKLQKETQPEPVVIVYGNVYDKKTKKPLSANINYNDLTANTDVGAASSNPTTGEYKIVLPCGKKYGFYAKKAGYIPWSDNLDLTEINEYQEIKRDLYLVPIKVDEEIILNNIFFTRGKADLLPSSYTELDRLVQEMKDNPKMEIEVQGHTNNIGDHDELVDLSVRRAEAVKRYLVEKDIDPNRISTVGYGPDRPIASNKIEAGRRKNQRVSFKIKKK